MEGSATHAHTPYSHCLFSAYSNMLWAYADCAHTHFCTDTVSPGTPPTSPPLSLFSRQAGPLVPGGREREWRRKRSVDPVICVCCLHPNSQFSPSFHLSFSPNLSCKFSSLSATLRPAESHTNILSIFMCFIYHLTDCATMHIAVTCKVRGTNIFFSQARN